MAVPRIRADYDQLVQVARRFGAASDAATASVKALQQNMQVLESGDWVGEGARAFYQEMSQSVLPSVKRLASALQAAQQATQAMRREMRQAEDAAAAIFRAVGAAGGAQTAANSAVGPARSAAAASIVAAAEGSGSSWRAAGGFGDGMRDEGQDVANELWDTFKKPLVEAWESGHQWRAIGQGALFAASRSGGVATGTAAVADAIRAARLTGRFADTVDAARALGRAARGSDEAAELANHIARQSTYIQDPATRVVLGKWEPAGGYIREAQASGGVWHETANGVSQAAGKQASWEIKQSFLRQMMEHGVDRLEFHGLDVEQELLNFDGQAFDALPAPVKEIRYLMDNARKYGYVQQGDSFVRA